MKLPIARTEAGDSDSGPHGARRLRQTFDLWDLVPLSISSVGPLFSVAATAGVMAALAGWWTLPAIGLLAVPFVVSSFIFRLLNRHFPHSGASYHWSARVIGRGVSRYQAWILILAYFTSIPPIAIPAGSYTLALVAPGYHASGAVHLIVTLFWILFAAVPLLMGGRPTAHITRVFFAVEMCSFVAFAVLGVLNWNRLKVPIHFGRPPIGGILIVAVIAATILDGWEIDSYAAEESAKPRSHSGVAGIVGALGALGFYAVLYPLLLGETPHRLLANANDPMTLWADRLIPSAPWLILIPVLMSTAGGLWLTSFILTRALFAMGRENLIPSAFSKLSRSGVPHVAIIVTFGLAAAVVVIELFISSLQAFFSLVLSTAGFFLLAEFLLDSVTAVVFLTVGHRKFPAMHSGSHRHRWMLAGALLSSVIMAGLLVTFVVYGPRAIGNGIDQTIAVMLVLGLVFAWSTRKRTNAAFVFDGNDSTVRSSKPQFHKFVASRSARNDFRTASPTNADVVADS
ncbi:MAG: APC family permease [Acidimicrobiales bacterium]